MRDVIREEEPVSKKEGATIVPSPEDIQQARRSAVRLRRLAKPRRRNAVRSITVEGEKQAIANPASAFQALADAVDEMAKGHAISITSHAEEVSTQKAADLLYVSRPYLIGLLEKGEIPFRKDRDASAPPLGRRPGVQGAFGRRGGARLPRAGGAGSEAAHGISVTVAVPAVIYDANVLYPAPLRDLLIRVAMAGLVRAPPDRCDP
jgi:hypothetical protein